MPSADGVIMIGNRPFPVAAINEQQRPMFAALRKSLTAIAHWHEQEVGCVVTVLIMDDALECA
ncbi:hypothetical protein X737_40130 [Mesorhizobium sp. L48C026A00]|nr:hypothetical protein X737_40130 [Mesorhizobium sp. L48C026A00]